MFKKSSTATIFAVFSVLLVVFVFVAYLNWKGFSNKVEVNKDSYAVDLRTIRRFQHYVTKFNKKYVSDSEFLARLKNFEKSLEEISRLNKLEGAKVFGLTKYSDWSEQEFRNNMLSYIETCKRLNRSSCPAHPGSYEDYTVFTNDDYILNADEQIVDWRALGKVGKVQNQRGCRACWAFAVIGVVESMFAIATNATVELSIQELISCCTYNMGCNNGEIHKALDFLCMHDYPIVDSKVYPLTLINEKCKFGKNLPPGTKIANFNNICNVNEKQILHLVARHGPVVAAVNAVPWKYYLGGVIRYGCEGKPEYLNHAIQIVGYNLKHDPPYYIIRNSWGPDFGDKGYVKLAIGSNVCGISLYMAYLSVK